MTATRETLYDPNAERAVIGSILIEPTMLDRLASTLYPEQFFLEPCQWAYNAAVRLHMRGLAVDLTTLESEMTTLGKWAEAGGIGFLTKCEASTPTASNALSYASIVRELDRRRRAFDVCRRVAAAALDGSDFAVELKTANQALQAMVEPATATSDPDRFKVTWATEALQEIPPVAWVIESLFSEGSVSLIVGEGGTKKTYSLLDAAVSVALGQPWVTFTTTPGLALVVDEESGQRRMQRRLAEVLRGHDAGPDTPIGYISLSGLNLLNGKDAPELQAVIEGNGAKFVVLDALADIMPGGDENAVKDVQPVFHALRVIANEGQCHIAVIHHANRMGTYRGSSALKGAVDLMLMVSCDDDRVTFTTEKARDIEPVKFAARANFGPGTFNLSPTELVDLPARVVPGDEYVMRYLREHPNASLDDLTDNADICSPEAARKAVYRLARVGKIRRTNSGGRGVRACYAVKEVMP